MRKDVEPLRDAQWQRTRPAQRSARLPFTHRRLLTAVETAALPHYCYEKKKTCTIMARDTL
ncbi:hypothetical protein EYF80_040229 [Liparis tanakae]|uniref:Uncharacterized protein n=1 Tax=Liparis tanakae TaxID=230148 RepID=A0A4Z2G9P4_9TELE|nr:hypothetical protein EYF80_040229 [Liparis tanakae]